jgi:hypothetical protein
VVAPPPPAGPEAPAPAPATLAASLAPPPVAGFADSGAAQDAARPFRPLASEAHGRLLEREKADEPAKRAQTKQQGEVSSDQVARRDARVAAPPPPVTPPAATAAANTAGAAPKTAMAESVAAQAAVSEGARTEADASAGAEAKKERARPAERKAAASGGAFAHPDDRALMMDKRYQGLLARRATSAAEARALSDAFELFARDVPADPRADEAHVRAIEAGVAAWKLGHDPADLTTARERGRAYLETAAPQAARVRTALEGLP